MEGILSHFNAKTLKNKEITCDILTQLLKETNKIFRLDRDYLENTIKKEYKYYKNEYKPLKRKYNLREIYNILMMK